MIAEQLRIREGARPGTYRFLMDDVDITGLVTRAECLLYFDGTRQAEPDGERLTRVIVGSTVKLPYRYSLIMYTEKTNGSTKGDY